MLQLQQEITATDSAGNQTQKKYFIITISPNPHNGVPEWIVTFSLHFKLKAQLYTFSFPN